MLSLISFWNRKKLKNFGYYENELILIKRFGAAVSSAESQTILDLIRLAYALYWSLRAYNFLLEKEIDKAQAPLGGFAPLLQVLVHAGPLPNLFPGSHGFR
jgi:hypothetical protein